MIKSNVDALSIIFPNSYDSFVPELVSQRLMASIPFASRYRIVDFLLSSMVNCGIDNISLMVRNNYYSLMDHLGSGREWYLTRKKRGLNIIPPFAEKSIKVYNGRVEALASILAFLKSQKEKYVIMADANIVVNFNFKDLIDKHIASGADVTLAYTQEELSKDLMEMALGHDDMYYTMELDGTSVKEIHLNSKEQGKQNLLMNICIINRELLIQQISEAYVNGYSYFERDILIPNLNKWNIQGYLFEGYVARITSTKSYFDENMKMLDEKNVDALFSPSPIYTKIRDDNPTRYINGAKVKNTMAADGCIIEGEVENCILFRGVKVAKGAKIKNCVLMQDTVVEAGARLEYVISDKNVTVSVGQEVKGTDTFPVYVEKHKTV